MKNKIFLSFLIFPFISYSQTKSIHLVKYEENINPLFSKVSKKINVALDRINIIDSPKAIILLKIDISDRKSELVGVGNSVGIGGSVIGYRNNGIIGGLLASSLNSSKQFSYHNTLGSVIFNKKQFDTLYNYFLKINTLLQKNDELSFFDITYNFNIDNLDITLDESKKVVSETDGYSKSYKEVFNKNIYLKIDESVYVFNEEEYKKFFNDVITNIKGNWDNNN